MGKGANGQAVRGLLPSVRVTQGWPDQPCLLLSFHSCHIMTGAFLHVQADTAHLCVIWAGYGWPIMRVATGRMCYKSLYQTD